MATTDYPGRASRRRKGSSCGGQFNRKLADVIGIQEDISKENLRKGCTQTDGGGKAAADETLHGNPEAYQLYLKGLYYDYNQLLRRL